MNKLTKIGVSALCGSLATVSAANAGDMAVTGTVDMSWISLDDETTGNPLGIGSNLGFSGTGELDNGWSVKLAVDHKNANAYSNTNVSVGVPGVGDFRISQGVSGSGIDRMDDKTPNVWEEAYGTGLGSGIDTVSGSSGGSNIEFTPSGTPDGITARFAYTPNAGGSAASDGAGSGVSASTAKSGWDFTVSATSDVLGVDGLTLYGGIAAIEQDSTSANISGDKDEKTVGVIYSVGGFTLGYQWSEEDLGRSSGATQYENDAYVITFKVIDDLSIGYNYYESAQSNSTNITAEAESVQIAYTMGGASIRLAEASVDNKTYTTGAANSRDATTLSVALAF